MKEKVLLAKSPFTRKDFQQTKLETKQGLANYDVDRRDWEVHTAGSWAQTQQVLAVPLWKDAEL